MEYGLWTITSSREFFLPSYRISGFRGGDYEEFYLLECNAM
jgi:hypothetical protein